MTDRATDQQDNPLTLPLGNEQLVIRRRYEVLSIINDFFIAIWFLLGSILFLFPEYEKAAIVLFIIGSAQFLVRPSIRLLSHLHLQRRGSESASTWES
ncbi:YrhK-like protein [Halopseudomonas sabulinigri]|uniref:YrhK-like protein n=1 Tax=Halopseudomonas sabulinigri TaxID=472181 RepID=A0A1H1NQP3_9GAMM|nr:YrhK family protein [Halopseudomonas sabulinigri]SDS01334.1 YrhK-like protein [Halopseudomonas sabulinigri]